MKTIAISALILFVFFASGANATERMAIDDLTVSIQNQYEKTADLKAHFIQEATLKSTGRTEREEGIVYFKKPKKMLWDYVKPQSKKLVLNPKTAWLFVPEDNMVYIQDSKNLFTSGQAIRFLSGIGRLRDEFSIKYAQPDHDASGNYLLEMTPKDSADSTGGVRNLLVSVEKNTFVIIKCTFRDAFGNKTVISFTDIKTNNSLPDSLFTFKPPAGVEIQNIQ